MALRVDREAPHQALRARDATNCTSTLVIQVQLPGRCKGTCTAHNTWSRGGDRRCVRPIAPGKGLEEQPESNVLISGRVFDNSNMRFHDALDDLLGNRLRVRALRVLTRSPSQRFTGRELARECHASPSQTISALQTLEESGIVLREVAGPSHVWRLSSEHVLADRLIHLFDQEAKLLEILKSEVRDAINKLEIQRAWLFGSVPRRQERPASDIDLLVQVKSPADKAKVEEDLGFLSSRFALKFGNPLSSVVLTKGQILHAQSPGPIESAQEEGILVKA